MINLRFILAVNEVVRQAILFKLWHNLPSTPEEVKATIRILNRLAPQTMQLFLAILKDAQILSLTPAEILSH